MSQIASVLRGEGIDVQVVNAKENKINDISEFDLVIDGTGIMINRGTGEPDKFLKKFQKELANKAVALFISAGGLALAEREGKMDEIESTRQKHLKEKAAKYNLNPVAMGLFSGVWDFNNLPWWSKKAMSGLKQKLEEAGFKETQPGIYDTRDCEAIRSWTKDLVTLIN